MTETSDTDDPALWSVDRVIQELCHDQHANWAGSGLSVPVPRAQEIERAFQGNDIDGDVLLQLGPSDFQAMNFTSIGQINKLNRIVLFLRTCSPIYSAQVKRSSSANIVKTIEPAPSAQPESPETSLKQVNGTQHDKQTRFGTLDRPLSDKATPAVGSRALFSSKEPLRNFAPTSLRTDNTEHTPDKDTVLDIVDRSIDAQQAQTSLNSAIEPNWNHVKSSASVKRPSDTAADPFPKRPRIQPSLESSTVEIPASRNIMLDVPFNRPKEDNSVAHIPQSLPTGSENDLPTKSIETTGLTDTLPEFYDGLLERYPVHDDQYVYPLYGDSEQEDREMTVESSTPEPEDDDSRDSESVYLPHSQVKLLIEDCIASFVDDWRDRKLALMQTHAFKKWQTATDNPGIRETMQKAMKKEHDHVTRRLSDLRDAISSMQYTKIDDIKKQCESLQPSVHQIEEYALYMQVLDSEEEPVVPVLVRKPRPRKRAHDPEDIVCESDDDDSLNDFLSSDNSDAYDDRQGIFYNSQSAKPPMLASDVDDDPDKSIQTGGYGESPHPLIDNSPVESEDVDELYDAPPALNPRTTFQYKAADWPATDADDEGGEGLITESANKLSVKKRAAEGKARNPLLLPVSFDSSDGEDAFDDGQAVRRPVSKMRRGKTSNAHEEIIVLSSSPSSPADTTNDESFEVRTPELNPRNMDPTSVKPESSSDAVFHTTRVSSRLVVPALLEADAISWDDLSNDPDGNGFLALAKAIAETDHQKATALLQYTLSFDLEKFEELLKDGIVFLRSDDQTDISEIPQNRQATAMLLTVMFMTYILIRKFTEADALQEWEGHLAWESIEPSAAIFRKGLIYLLRQRLSLAQNGAASVSNSDDDLLESSTKLGRFKQFKRKGKQAKRKDSPNTDGPLDTQRMAKERVAAQEARKVLINNRLAQTASQTGLIEVPVNFKEPLVMLDQHIAQRIKPHQINGVQFIWRELIEDTLQQGCLLAHTMGLGKTMQVISVLVTIAQCLKSSDPAMKAHIPPALHDLRILIISPPALSENWYDELVFWMPEHDTLGPICKITNRSKQPYYEIKQWSESGGVLLIGYDRLVSYTKTPSRNQNEPDDQYQQKCAQHEDMARWLFDLPKIVIADEAHMLKNPTAKRAETAMKIKTMSRIALTGSPLSNHLEEYWAMINFIAPGYLGDLSKFKQKYVEPINRCLSLHSGAFDRRLGLRKMHVLKKILDPKVNRADITAIQNDLPSKTELFITVPLTDVQLEMYQICVDFFRSISAEGGLVKGKTASLWQWIAVLSLLCNHPWTFQQKLNDPERKKKARKLLSEDTEDISEDDVAGAEPGGDDIDVAGQPTMLEAMKLALAASSVQTLDTASGLQNSILSHRMMLVKAIIEEALKLHEKVLVFSHSLLTLDYMEVVMKSLSCPFERIDGGLATDKRQLVAKEFNAGLSKAQAFLISTRAGGLGLNLFGATRVIILDYSFNPSWEEQAIGRAYRLGQKKPVYVYRFRSGGTFEDVTFNQTIYKTQLFKRIIDHKAVLRKGSKFEAGKYLIDPGLPPKEDFSECKGKDPEIMDKLINEFDCIYNIDLTETFAQDIDEGLTAIEIEEANQEIEDEKLARDDPHAYMMRLASRAAQSHQGLRLNTGTSQPNFPSSAEQLLATTIHGVPSTSTTATPYVLPSSAPPGQSGPSRQSWTDEGASYNTKS